MIHFAARPHSPHSPGTPTFQVFAAPDDALLAKVQAAVKVRIGGHSHQYRFLDAAELAELVECGESVIQLNEVAA